MLEEVYESVLLGLALAHNDCHVRNFAASGTPWILPNSFVKYPGNADKRGRHLGMNVGIFRRWL